LKDAKRLRMGQSMAWGTRKAAARGTLHEGAPSVLMSEGLPAC